MTADPSDAASTVPLLDPANCVVYPETMFGHAQSAQTIQVQGGASHLRLLRGRAGDIANNLMWDAAERARDWPGAPVPGWTRFAVEDSDPIIEIGVDVGTGYVSLFEHLGLLGEAYEAERDAQ